MLASIVIFLIGVMISFFEIPALIKKKRWREITTYFLLLAVGLTLSFLVAFDVTIPSPIDWINKFYSPVTSFMERILS